jgi:hypothetical protein
MGVDFETMSQPIKFTVPHFDKHLRKIFEQPFGLIATFTLAFLV